MNVDISPNQVLNQIKQLQSNGEILSKKKIKQSYPDLMKSALYYFPSWEHAVQNADILD